MKIAISTSRGGHLDQLLQIFEAFENHNPFFIIVSSKMTLNLKDDYRVHYVRKSFTESNSLFQNSFLIYLIYFLYQLYLVVPCLLVLLKEKPKVIICNGGEASLVVSFIGKILGIKIIYLESLTRTEGLSVRGKIFYYIADKFLVQWESLASKYEKAEYWGKVI